MPSPVIGLALLSALYVIYQYVYKTDTPKIKGLPEIPGWPLFGSLFELGEYHAKVAQKWSEKYGPVFQVRLGNRACRFQSQARGVRSEQMVLTYHSSENRLRKLFSVRPPLLDNPSVCPHLPSNPPHLPHPCLRFGKLHNWNLSVG